MREFPRERVMGADFLLKYVDCVAEGLSDAVPVVVGPSRLGAIYLSAGYTSL